ncbi:caspase family protein [Sorangium sp. So ce131]|uniref:caspase family protein n=1 Tax=Sorangium sp. So ce131 TaxID=3133282 RepID=UPI003F5D8058
MTWKGEPGWFGTTGNAQDVFWFDGRNRRRIPFFPDGDPNKASSAFIRRMAASADGSTAAWIAEFRFATELFWAPIRRGATPRALELPSWISSVALSARGELAVVGADPTSYLGDPAPVYLVHLNADPPRFEELAGGAAELQSVAISPDGRLVAAAGTQLVVWDRARGRTFRRELAELDRSPAEGKTFSRVAFSPDGTWIAAAADSDVHLFEAASQRYRGGLGDSAQVRIPSWFWFLDETRLAAVSPGRITKWSLTDGCVLRHDWLPASQVAAPADGESLLLVRDLYERHDVCKSGELALSIQQWFGLELGASAPATCPDPAPAQAAEGPSVEAEAAATCLHTGERDGDHDWVVDAPRRLVAYAVIVDERGQTELSISDLDGGRRRRLAESRDTSLVGFSRDGRLLVGELRNSPFAARKVFRVWSVDDGRKLGDVPLAASPPASPFGLPDMLRVQVTSSADGSRLGFSVGRRAVVVEAPSLRPLAEVELPAGNGPADISAIAVASGATPRWVLGTERGELLVYDADRLVGRTEGGGGSLIGAALSPSAATAATLSDDGAIRIWSLPDGRLRGTLVDFHDDEYLAFTPAGSFAGTSEAAERIGVAFDGPSELFRFERFFEKLHDPQAVARSLRGEAATAPLPLTRPPRVEVLGAPQAAGADLLLRVRVQGSRPLARVQAFREGRPLGTPVRIEACSDSVELRVQPPPGTSRIEIVAFDEAGLASNPARVDITGAPAGAARLWVLAVGVKSYPLLEGFEPLQAADADALAVIEALRAHTGPGREFPDIQPITLVDQEATPTSILEGLEKLAGMGEDDVAIIYLSGHGARMGDGGEMTFLTGKAAARGGVLDAESVKHASVPWTQVGEALRRLRGRVLLLLDACHSGAFARGVVVPSTELARNLVRDQRAGVIVFASSKGRQRSQERTYTDALGNVRSAGLFREALVRSLESPKTDLDGDGAIRVSELVAAVTLDVDRVSRGKQTPWVPRRETFSDFEIVRAPQYPPDDEE